MVRFGRIMDLPNGPKQRLAVGYNSAKSEPIWMKSGIAWAKCLCWPWQILDTIRVVATIWKKAEFSFFCEVINARFRRFPLRTILRHFNMKNNVNRCRHVNFRNRILKMSPKGVVFQKNAKILKNLPGLATSGRHNSVMMTVKCCKCFEGTECDIWLYRVVQISVTKRLTV